MHEPIVTISGNAVADAEERAASTGRSFTVFRLANTIRRRLGDGSYEDVRTDFYRVTVFGTLAVNAAKSVKKGQRILVHGRLRVASFTRPDGTEGANIEVTATMVGHDLTFGWVDYHKGRADREDPNDPQNDPAVQRARIADDAGRRDHEWGRHLAEPEWNPTYVEDLPPASSPRTALTIAPELPQEQGPDGEEEFASELADDAAPSGDPALV
jgi:single-strand DNA-binding protein